MPEGHSVHRIANQFAQTFVGHRVSASSPQGRFAAGAAQLDGALMTGSKAVGKQLFLEFEGGLFLRVHLGLYGAWDFAGRISTEPTAATAGGRRGRARQQGLVLDADGEDSPHSIGAPRTTRLRMAESERRHDDVVEGFPPEPVGQVRVRLLIDDAVADLRGPTKCEVLTPSEVDEVLAKLGPDPLVDSPRVGERRFRERIAKTRTPIGLLLMDQSVVSGIGNIYRAEMLFRARLNPWTPGSQVPPELATALWRDWTKLLKSGVELGQMMTRDGLRGKAYERALAKRDERHWVYHREGLPCRVCRTNVTVEDAAGRKLYWCPSCQAGIGPDDMGPASQEAS